MTNVSTDSSALTAAPTIDDLDVAIRQLSGDINRAQYQLLILIHQFNVRRGWIKWGFRNGSEWLAWRCGLTLSAAREKVRTANALGNLPEISRAFQDGRLSYSKVRALTRAADRDNEDLLLAYALSASASQVEERCRQMRNVQPDSVRDAQRSWERRTLSVWRNESRGTLSISLEVPLEAGELITQALDRAVAAGETASGPEFTDTTWHTQQADAMVAIARSYLSGAATEPTATADHYQVVLHVDEQALRGGAGRSDLPIETVRRLSCDGSVVRVVENAGGEPLDVGRKRRTIPVAIKRALWSRDRGCTFPGCHNSRFVDAHHIRHWSEGGETSLDNLLLLCSHHHRLVHEGRYRIRRNSNQSIYFQRRDGRTIPDCGYGTEDVQVLPEDSEDASAEGPMKPRARKPGQDIRERSAPYRLSG